MSKIKFVDKMAASQEKKSIFDQNFGLKLFIKKKYLSVRKISD